MSNVGIEITPRQIAEGIVEREEEERRDNLHIDRIADPAIFDKSRGDSVADQMRPENGQPGVLFSKGDNTRLAGLMQFHERLRFRQDGRPMVYFFNTCKDFIRTVPNLPYDETKVEDIDTDAEDHAYDAARYRFMDAPLIPKQTRTRRPKTFNPLDD
jgi:hypothetical protein